MRKLQARTAHVIILLWSRSLKQEIGSKYVAFPYNWSYFSTIVIVINILIPLKYEVVLVNRRIS